MDKKSNLYRWLSISLIFIIISTSGFLIIWNSIKYDNFLDTSLIDIITIIVTLVIALLIINLQNTRKSEKENCIYLTNTYINFLSEFTISENASVDLKNQKRLEQLFELLKKYEKKYNLTPRLELLKTSINGIKDQYSFFLEDVDNISVVRSHINNHSLNMIFQLEQIKIEIS